MSGSGPGGGSDESREEDRASLAASETVAHTPTLGSETQNKDQHQA